MTEYNQYAQDLLLLTKRFPPLEHYYVLEDGGPEVVMEAYKNNKPIPVYTGDSEDTIWGEPEINWLFRAHHDTLHLRHNIPFTLLGEYKVAEIHSALAELMGLRNLARVMRIDVAAFATYQHEYDGKYAPQTLTKATLELIDIAVSIERDWGEEE